MLPFTGTTAMFMGTDADDYELHQLHLLSTSFEHLGTGHAQDDTAYDNYIATDGIDPLGLDLDDGPLSARRPQAFHDLGWPDHKTPRGLLGGRELYSYNNTAINNNNKSGTAERAMTMWPSNLDCLVRGGELDDPLDESDFWAPSLSRPSLPQPQTQADEARMTDPWQGQRLHQQQQQQHQQQQQNQQQQHQSTGSDARAHALSSAFSWPPRAADGLLLYGTQAGITPPPDPTPQHNNYDIHQRHHSYSYASPVAYMSAMHSEARQAPRARVNSEELAVYRGPTQAFGVARHQSITEAGPAAWGFFQQQQQQQQNNNNGIDGGHKQQASTLIDAVPPRQGQGLQDGSAHMLTSFQFPARAQTTDQSTTATKPRDSESSTGGSVAPPAKTFKPMQMVFRERDRRASASSTGTSSSGGGGGSGSSGSPTSLSPFYYTGAPGASSAMTAASAAAAANTPSLPSLAMGTAALSHDEQFFRRQQGISLNYRGDIHNPHNRGDHVPAHVNTSLFLMGLPPQATVGDLLRAVAQLGPTGRVFAASVNPPDPTRRLPLAAAKISYFTRAQAEQLKALVDAQQLVMYGGGGGDNNKATPHVVRCSWNRDKKAPRRCVQASECRVLRIRGPRSVVNFASLTAYFEEKFRYELQDVQVVSESDSGSSGGDEQTMEWRFASFQSQAIAAKMALNQERKMVRVEYGRDPCEWGEL